MGSRTPAVPGAARIRQFCPEALSRRCELHGGQARPQTCVLGFSPPNTASAQRHYCAPGRASCGPVVSMTSSLPGQKGRSCIQSLSTQSADPRLALHFSRLPMEQLGYCNSASSPARPRSGLGSRGTLWRQQMRAPAAVSPNTSVRIPCSAWDRLTWCNPVCYNMFFVQTFAGSGP